MEDVEQLLRVLNLLVFGGITLVAGRHWLRDRQPAAGWLALCFGSVATYTLSRILFENESLWLLKAELSLLSMYPYLLFRFAASFRPVGRRLRVGLGLLTVSVIAWLLSLPSIQSDTGEREWWFWVFVVAFLTHWLVLSTTVAVQLWADRHQPRVVRWRMRIMAGAAMVMAASLLLLGFADDPLRDYSRLLMLLSGLMFYVGYAPPSWLRGAWRRPEQVRLQQSLGSLVSSSTVSQVGESLLPIAAPLVAARAIALVDHEGNVVASHDVTGSAGYEWLQEDAGDVRRLDFPFGQLVVRVGRYTPFFGNEELELLDAIGQMANLAVERIEHVDRAAAATEQLAAIVDAADDAILSKTTDGIITSWNHGCERLYGYSAAEVVGQPIAKLFPTERLDEEAEILAEIRDGRSVENYESQRLHKDGTPIDVSLTVSPIRDETGAIVGASTIARDISQRKRTEAAQERARLLLESTSEGIYGIDNDGRCTFINHAGADSLGYEPAELVGRDMHQTIHHTRPDGRRYPSDECPIFRATRKGVTCRVEDELLWRSDGSSFDASYSSSPIEKEGQIVGAVVTFADIAERKRLQQELERTALELADANAELKQADELKSQFLAMASHELRTPLTAIAGFTSTLLSLGDQLTEEQKREFLQIIDRQTDRLQRLVGDLLTLSRIESGRIEAHPQPVNVSLAIKQTIRELGAEEVVVTCDPEDVAARADPDHLQQILINYVGNAVKYGNPPITVGVTAVEGGVEIRVCDEGEGVPEQFVPRLFERFSQARSGNTEIEGTGLGLSIVRGLAQVQGGDVWYEPNEPRGSRFCVRLPKAGERSASEQAGNVATRT